MYWGIDFLKKKSYICIVSWGVDELGVRSSRWR